MLSEAKRKAIFAAAEDVLFDIDKDHSLSDEELADRIVVQARFITTSNPPTIPESTKSACRKVIAIADGPEPSEPLVDTGADDIERLRAVFDEANRSLVRQAVAEAATIAPPAPQRDPVEATPSRPTVEVIVRYQDDVAGARVATVYTREEAHLLRHAGIEPAGEPFGAFMERTIAAELDDDFFGVVRLSINAEPID